MKHKINKSDFVSWATANQTEKFHAVLCDPPYGISFMGKAWDDAGGPKVFQSQAKSWGAALLPLLYPGALVFMFAGTRMWHRLAAGMEDAGFHLWDTLMWLHGQGFPKAQDISKLIDKSRGDVRQVVGRKAGERYKYEFNSDFNPEAATSRLGSGDAGALTAPGSELSAPWTGHKTPQLKPAWEPILCFRAPANEKYADLALKYGSGALNVDAGRIGTDLVGWGGGAAGGNTWNEDNCGLAKSGDARPVTGRYPANLALDKEAAEMLDKQTGILKSGKSKPEYRKKAKNNIYGLYKNDNMPINVIGDSGGASRFFYVAKATQKERHAGVNGKNEHPTVKPIELNRWLASLLLPPSSVTPRRLLVPFSGVGSEMIGAFLAGWDEVVGVEMDEKYCEIAEQRIKFHKDIR